MDLQWLLILLIALTPVWAVLAMTFYVLICRAVQRRRARKDQDEIAWERYTQP